MSVHLAVLAVVSVGVAYVMVELGVAKAKLEWRTPRRTCPSCGRHTRSCRCR